MNELTKRILLESLQDKIAICEDCDWKGQPSDCEIYEETEGFGPEAITYHGAICPKCNGAEVRWIDKVEYEKSFTMTLNEMLEMGNLDSNIYEGFRIGRGKKIYWYVTPMPKSGLYKCLPIEEHGMLGWPRWIPGINEITIVPKRQDGIQTDHLLRRKNNV